MDQPLPHLDSTPTPPPVPAKTEFHPESTSSKKLSKTFYILVGIVVFVFAGVSIYFIQYGSHSQSKTPTIAQAPTKPLFLDIQSPQAGDEAVNNEVLVKGKTLPNTTVMIYDDNDDASTQSDDQGNFQGTLLIDDTGSNVNVTAYDNTGKDISKTFFIAASSSQ